MGCGHDRIKYYRLTPRKKRELIEKLRVLLASDRRVKLAYVFGGFTRRNSVRDVDVAVYAAEPLGLRDLLRIGSKLELELGIPVDVVQLQDIGPRFRLEVLRRGLLLLARDGELRERLLSQAVSELEDQGIAASMAKRA